MSHSPLISVIIPIYKVEMYLCECVDSVLAQTYHNLEIILVDDGSPDNCPQICDDYAAADNRVKVIHKPNGGLSDARNAGIDIAIGEYLSFVDSDDWVSPDMIDFLYNNLVVHDADISCCGHYRSFVGLDFLPDSSKALCHHQLLSNVEAATMAHNTNFPLSAWGKLYKKHIFDTMRYPVGKLYEDQRVIIDVFMAAHRVSIDLTPKYHYRKRKDSIVRKHGKIAISLMKMEVLEERHGRIEMKYPVLIPVSQAALYRHYMKVISAILSETGYSKTSCNYEIMSVILKKIKRNTVYLLRNPYLTMEERMNLLLLRMSVRLHRPYIKFQALMHPKRTKKRKKKKEIKQSERILFE